MDRTINICLSTSDKYSELCTIVMMSVIVNAKENTAFHFFVIDNGVTEANKGQIKQLIRSKGADIDFLPLIDIEAEVGAEIDPGRWTLSTMQRLFICRQLSKDVHRILYLDCDMLVRRSLDDLYFMDLGEKYYCAGVLDCVGTQNRLNIGLGPRDSYINAGMLLIDVDKWRAADIETEFVVFLKSHLNRLQYFDQDIINGVFGNRIKIVHPKFNVVTTMFNYSRKELMIYRSASVFYTEQEYKEAIDNPVIVHFTLDTVSVRPWFENGEHMYRDEWLGIRKMPPWAEMPLWKDERSMVAKAKMFLFGCLPRPISVRLARYVNRHNTKRYKLNKGDRT
ncbi:General stress protein A [Sporomusa ovata DSM 2662]|uniref:Glycosyl transferase, family 8 n=1 Tax=Sporomusa ovata TaxID=2378 RepID=A0A0U1KV17_9FIRM|nr:glycosyltransferase family 8 protein [Sporomusa ovata]EQB26450.1 general stress protein A [Sporomusa ovata DSM 2662]CQR70534.1 Glycosyl transferase, family 8 [Sporomusa ovata]